MAAEERGIYLRALLASFYRFGIELGERVYHFTDCIAVYVDLYSLFAAEHAVLRVRHLFQVVNSQK
jgi:hypothetical protein